MSAKRIDCWIVPCQSCQKAYNAFETVTCNCITREASLVCPHCLKCFCNASARYKSDFWLSAPSTIVERRKKELASDSAKPVAAENIESGKKPGRLVLVVDDSRLIRALVRNTLEQSGFNVIEAGDALNAIRSIRDARPDVVVTDALMPGMDGREMCRAIKADPKLRSTRVVIMSGLYTAARYRNEALTAFGADGYLLKPIEADKLIGIVESFCPNGDLQLSA